MKVVITAGDGVLQRFSNRLGAIGEGKARRVLVYAVNRTTTTVHGRVIRTVSRILPMQRKIVAPVIKRRLASIKSGAIEGVVYGTGRPLPLKLFAAKQFWWGVRARVWGKTERHPGAFIWAGTWRSGKPVAGGHVFRRVTTRSKPIEKQFGPSIPEAMVKDATAKVFQETVAEMLPRRVEHEINRLLP